MLEGNSPTTPFHKKPTSSTPSDVHVLETCLIPLPQSARMGTSNMPEVASDLIVVVDSLIPRRLGFASADRGG